MAREKGREDGAEHSKESEPAAVFPPFLLFICFCIFRDESQVIQLFFSFFFPVLIQLVIIIENTLHFRRKILQIFPAEKIRRGALENLCQHYNFFIRNIFDFSAFISLGGGLCDVQGFRDLL